MSTPLEDFAARLAELKADLAFITTASHLRPRLGEILQWDGPKEILHIAQEFMGAREARSEGIYGPLLVRLMAVFERYLRLLIIEGVEYHTSIEKTFDEIPTKLANRNLMLTGRILANFENPRDYLTINIEGLIVNLASCKAGSTSFSLNSQAFSNTIMGVNPNAIEKALES